MDCFETRLAAPENQYFPNQSRRACPELVERGRLHLAQVSPIGVNLIWETSSFEKTLVLGSPSHHKIVILRACAFFVYAKTVAIGRGSGRWKRRQQLPCPLATVLSLQQPSPCCHPDRSEPGFPATQRETKPRMRLSLKERRMKSANAVKAHRKSGVAEGGICGAPFGCPQHLPLDNYPLLICHPSASLERSAHRWIACHSAWWRGVEGPRRCLSAHALRSFSTTAARLRICASQLRITFSAITRKNDANAGREKKLKFMRRSSRVQRLYTDWLEEDATTHARMHARPQCVLWRILFSGFSG
jgi:hypothetical protein